MDQVPAHDGVDEFPEEPSFITTNPLETASGNVAIVREAYGKGWVVFFDFAPTFRGQWKEDLPIPLHALYLSSNSE